MHYACSDGVRNLFMPGTNTFNSMFRIANLKKARVYFRQETLIVSDTASPVNEIWRKIVKDPLSVLHM